VLVVLASTGLAYELSLGAVESFLLGEPVSSFALIISGTMVALGLGSYLSSWIKTELELRFIDAAVATATVGGASAPMLYVVFGLHGPFRFVLYAATLLIGTLVGLTPIAAADSQTQRTIRGCRGTRLRLGLRRWPRRFARFFFRVHAIARTHSNHARSWMPQPGRRSVWNPPVGVEEKRHEITRPYTRWGRRFADDSGVVCPPLRSDDRAPSIINYNHFV